LLGRRPDVDASRRRVEAAAQDIKVARARFYPDINLLGFIGFQSIDLSQLADAGSRTMGVGPALSLPLFDGGRLRSELATTHADYDAAVAQYNATLIEALQELANELAAFHSVATQSTEQRLAMAAAREAYDLAMLRYRDGIGTYLTVLSAQSQVLKQRHLEADLRAREFDNHIDLVRTLGGGFEETAVLAKE
jgi:NodT family efflux transporter outer membrane factor (OMF) lipoprotein